MSFRKSLNSVVFSGVNERLDPHLFRRVLFSNVIFLSLPVVYFAFMLLDYHSYVQPLEEMNFDNFSVPLIILFCGVGLFLNKAGLSYLGRLSFLIVWPLLMQILPITLMGTPSDYYLAYPFGLVFHAVLIQLTISSKKETFTFYFLMAASFMMLFFSLDFLLYFEVSPDMIDNPIINNEYYILVAILYWLLFNTMTYYVIKVLDDLIEKNERQKSLLVKKNRQLSQMNEVVDNANKNLELEVKKRTKELEEANDALANYAFYNAHTIKGPFCRIKGLVMLEDRKAILANEFREKLGLSIDELDDAIAQMQEQLDAADKTGAN